MARGSRRSADPIVDANAEIQALLSSPEMQPLAPLAPFSLPLLEDYRTFHPAGPDRDPLSFDRVTEVDVYDQVSRRTVRRPYAGKYRGARPYGGTTQGRSRLSAQIGFRDSDRVAICVRRKRRKEVLHALRKAGRGSGRRRRFNAYSKIRC